MEDVFEVQDEIARSIAAALRIKLSPHEAKAIAVKPTENLQAYDCYLRARSFARRVTRTDLEFALQMYERAIELDPGFAVAYAGLANVCGLYFEWHEREARWIEKGLAASEKALELSPNLPEALSARARIFYAQKDYEKAARLRRAGGRAQAGLRRRLLHARPRLLRERQAGSRPPPSPPGPSRPAETTTTSTSPS